MAEKSRRLRGNPFVTMPKGISPLKTKLPRIHVPRGPTVRWDINYELLFRRKLRRK